MFSWVLVLRHLGSNFKELQDGKRRLNTGEDERKTSTLQIINILRIPKCGDEIVEEFIFNDFSHYRLNLHRK